MVSHQRILLPGSNIPGDQSVNYDLAVILITAVIGLGRTHQFPGTQSHQKIPNSRPSFKLNFSSILT